MCSLDRNSKITRFWVFTPVGKGKIPKNRFLMRLASVGMVFLLLGCCGTIAFPQGDSASLIDPTRSVMELGRDYAVIQYFTTTPCETRVQIRQGNLPATAWQPDNLKQDLWKDRSVRVVRGEPGIRTYHRIRIDGLKPGTRYYYRVYDPDCQPTAEERRWCADPPWRREYAFATLAPQGYKTIIHLPVKVLLVTNVVNVESAYADPNNPAPPPAPFSQEELARIREEYAIASRYFWVNSGMRVWVDFRIFVDDRWQRWGPEPAQAEGFYKGLPLSRAYPGVDFAPPGGGAFTIFDTKDPLQVYLTPVYEEQPYAGQIEQAFPRRWNPQAKRWEFYNSGGGTFGVDSFPDGIPARSQFLGGGDTAWLATHEFHHQMESYGAFSLANREDERIVFNHPEPRYRRVNPDGSISQNAWNTAGRHGEHWNVMAYWDRTLTDSQRLRLYFGEAITVRDSDRDGFPDDDPRLPLDEKRFGSDPRKAKTDGQLNDLRKAMLSTWAPAPLQKTFVKPAFQSRMPNPRNPDSDGDGLPDTVDPYPLYPWVPLIPYRRIHLDGKVSEWDAIPPAGVLDQDGRKLVFKQAHDGDYYYALFIVQGGWARLHIGYDGEGKGIYSGEGTFWLEIRDGEPPSVRVSSGKVEGLLSQTARTPDGKAVIEIAIPNGSESPWFWLGGGREIGVSISLYTARGTGYSVYEPYDLFYARMMEPVGTLPPPADAPEELATEHATARYTPAQSEGLVVGAGWRVEGDAWVHEGHDESLLRIPNLNATEFDLWVRFEAQQDGVLGAFLTTTTEMNAGRDYIVFVGGYQNTRTRFRLFGAEVGDSEVRMTPGVHMLQLSRRNGWVWALFDGKPILWARDPNPQAIIGTLALIGGYDGKQRVYEIRVRVKP